MPLYEYRCRSCDKTFEEIVGPSDDVTQIACPVCGAKNPERQVSSVARCCGGDKTADPAPPSCGPRGGFS